MTNNHNEPNDKFCFTLKSSGVHFIVKYTNLLYNYKRTDLQLILCCFFFFNSCTASFETFQDMFSLKMGNLLPRNNCINRKITISTELCILVTEMNRALNRLFNRFGGKENREEIKIKRIKI